MFSGLKIVRMDDYTSSEDENQVYKFKEIQNTASVDIQLGGILKHAIAIGSI